jgi:hypothetical protein
MNRIKRELLNRNMFHLASPDCFNQYYVEDSRIEYYADFVRVTVYWNVVTIDYVLDKHFNRVDVNELNERSLASGKSLKAEALENVELDSIREYPNGLKIYEVWDGVNHDFKTVYAEI